MHWEVSGADRQSGVDRTVIVEAETEASASRRASRQGMMVSHVRCLDPNDRVAVAVANSSPPFESTASDAKSGRVELPAVAPPATPASRESTIYATSLHPAAVFIVPLLLIPVFGIGLLGLPFAYLNYRFTSFTVTTERVTIKRGWLSRKTFEMLLTKIESIHVDQPLLGRLLGTGTVVICGTGGSREVFQGFARRNDFA